MGQTDLKLNEYAQNLPPGEERDRVVQALHDAEHVPADPRKVDDVEARYGDAAGTVDINAFLTHEFRSRTARSEAEGLMLAAEMLRIRPAFIEVETPEGKRFVRIDSMQ